VFTLWCYTDKAEESMARLTITLPDDLHRALKESAARRDRTIGELVAESLAFYGIKGGEAARDLVERARERAKLQESEALALAVDEVRAARGS
jgi:predicted transcriptional regulator